MRILARCLVACVIVASMLGGISCSKSIVLSDVNNLDVISFANFTINTESVGLTTNTKGSVFVSGNLKYPNARHVTITAWVETDPRDWGGVGLLCPPGWNVTKITSDFPQGIPHPESFITIWDKGVEDWHYQRYIIIGGSGHMAPDTINGSGKGNIVIELDPFTSEPNLPATFDISIGAGSHGVTVFPEVTKLQMPLN
jgi:hypothetical protein